MVLIGHLSMSASPGALPDSPAPATPSWNLEVHSCTRHTGVQSDAVGAVTNFQVRLSKQGNRETQKEGPHIACSCSSCASIVPAVNMTLNEPPAMALHGCHDELHVLLTRGIRVRPCPLSCARPRVATVACQTRAGSSASRREARVVVVLFRLGHPRDPSANVVEFIHVCSRLS